MRAGRLNKRIILQAPTTGKDAGGGPTDSWVDQVTVWAAGEPLDGEERKEAAKEMASVDYRWIIRFRTGILETWRVKYEDHATSPATARYFDIEFLKNPREGRTELHLMCLEKPSGELV